MGAAVGYGAGGCEMEHQDRPTVVFLLELQGPTCLTLSAGHNGGVRASHARTWMRGAGRVLEVCLSRLNADILFVFIWGNEQAGQGDN